MFSEFSAGGGGCASPSALVPIAALSFFDAALVFVASYQVFRIHLRNLESGWTRQEVLHLMLGCSNFGYFIFFILTLVAQCERWLCWSKMCGFIFMAFPKILFLAAFLLLLSFCQPENCFPWCSTILIYIFAKANDEEEDEDNDIDGNSSHQSLLDPKATYSPISERRRGCCSFHNLEVGSRQKFVIAVVGVVFIMMLSFAFLIWIGTMKNPIDSLTVAQIYAHICAVTSLVIGGALGYYGILLFIQLRKVRSERTSADMWKVGGLGAISILCFTISALIALLTDIPLFYSMRLRDVKGLKLPLLLIAYHFIGVTVPSSFLFWVMRELPRPIVSPSQGEQRVITFISFDPSIMHNSRQRAAGTSSTNQVK